jgi:hypothetical protein
MPPSEALLKKLRSDVPSPAVVATAAGEVLSVRGFNLSIVSGRPVFELVCASATDADSSSPAENAMFVESIFEIRIMTTSNRGKSLSAAMRGHPGARAEQPQPAKRAKQMPRSEHPDARAFYVRSDIARLLALRPILWLANETLALLDWLGRITLEERTVDEGRAGGLDVFGRRGADMAQAVWKRNFWRLLGAQGSRRRTPSSGIEL